MNEERKDTLLLRAENPGDLARAADLLRRGGTVAFPTETVYGLGANALDGTAVRAIFLAKQRPAWDPLIVHVSDQQMLHVVADVTGDLLKKTEALMKAFWPGPLTVLLPRSAAIPDAVTAGRTRVGVRMPAHPVALALIGQTGVPLAAPSANRFGHTSPTTAAHVLEDLNGRIDAVLDGGATPVGVESTVLDLCEQPMRLYRPGAVSLEDIAAVGGATMVFGAASLQSPGSPGGLPSPGLDLRHYAPNARLLLVADAAELVAVCSTAAREGRVGAMLPDGWKTEGASESFAWGPWHDPAVLAQRLFAGLRVLEQMRCATIVCPLPAEAGGLSSALRDRLRKAARSA